MENKKFMNLAMILIMGKKTRAAFMAVLFAGLITAMLSGCIGNTGKSDNAPQTWKFDLGSGKTQSGFTKITKDSIFTNENGMGIICDLDAIEGKSDDNNNLTNDWISANAPFYFKKELPEGRYKITVTLGNSIEETATTVKAESRRLMLENVKTNKGEVVTRTFVVDVRTPRINDTLSINLKSRELPYLNWDKYLSIEFNGANPCVSSIIIEEANDLPVIFLAGNSTVVDQENEPWASWGQMFPRFLKPTVVVANYAESGETLLSFKGRRRLQKIVSVMKPGDYLFMEFAHNDQKPGSCHVDPFTTYQDELRFFMSEARSKGGIPVLVTSTNRRKFNEEGKIVNTLAEYPEAMRQLAKEENVPLVDLNAMSKLFYEALGVEGSKKAFVHYPANTFPYQRKALADNTHFNTYGAYELAKCVVQEILDNQYDLVQFIVDDWESFNPNSPDDWKTFFWSDSPSVEIVKPDGN